MLLTNSVSYRIFTSLCIFIKKIYLNSNFHSIFNRRLRPSNSKIIRKLIDEDITANSFFYLLINSKNNNKTESKENNSLFLNAIKKPFILINAIGGFLFLVFFLFGVSSILRSYKIASFGLILIAMNFLLKWIVDKKIFNNSLIVNFFKYAYSDGGLKDD